MNVIHCLDLMSIFVKFFCHPSPNVQSWIQTRDTCRMVQQSDVILLVKVLCQAGILNFSIVLLKTLSLTHGRGPSVKRDATSSPIQMLFDTIEGKEHPRSTVPCRKHFRWNLLVIPVMLEGIEIIKFIFFSSENKTFFHLSTSRLVLRCKLKTDI